MSDDSLIRCAAYSRGCCQGGNLGHRMGREGAAGLARPNLAQTSISLTAAWTHPAQPACDAGTCNGTQVQVPVFRHAGLSIVSVYSRNPHRAAALAEQVSDVSSRLQLLHSSSVEQHTCRGASQTAKPLPDHLLCSTTLLVVKQMCSRLCQAQMVSLSFLPPPLSSFRMCPSEPPLRRMHCSRATWSRLVPALHF